MSGYPDGVTGADIGALCPSEWNCPTCGDLIEDSDESFEYMGETICSECMSEIGDNQ